MMRSRESMLARPSAGSFATARELEDAELLRPLCQRSLWAEICRLCCVAIGGPAQLKVALDISALPVSLFEMPANLIARKIQGSMSPDTSLNVSGLTRPRVCNGSWSCRNAAATDQMVVAIDTWGFGARTAAIGI
jgi:hypothetical protein